jgi:formylmethanofuran dehydrogenase subunit D
MNFVLNTGRTIKQGSYVEQKNSEVYRNEASACRMNPVDMMELDLEDGATIKVSSPGGSVVMRAFSSQSLKRGEVFVSLGPYANHIVDGETHGTGMPDFKTTLVQIEPTGEEVVPVSRLMEECGGVPYED